MEDKDEIIKPHKTDNTTIIQNIHSEYATTPYVRRCPVDQGTNIGLDMQAILIILIRSDCAPVHHNGL